MTVQVTISNGTTSVTVSPVAVRLHKIVPALVYGIPETDESGNVILDAQGVQATVEIVWIDNFANLQGGNLGTLWSTFVTGNIKQTDTLTIEWVGGWTWNLSGRVVDFRVEPIEASSGKVRVTMLFRVGSL